MIDDITGDDGSNKVFSVKIKSLGDLSNSTNDTKQMSTDKLLRLQQGDVIKGETETKEKVSGTVVSIKKDSEAQIIEVEVESNGVVHSLVLDSIEFEVDGEKGNQPTEVPQRNVMSFNDYQNNMYEKEN